LKSVVYLRIAAARCPVAPSFTSGVTPAVVWLAAARAAENAGVVRWCDGPGSAAGGRELRFPDAKFQESGEKRQSVDFLARPASTIFPGMSATLRVPSFSHDLLPNNRHDVLSEAPR
jgi:hypothetical protein